MVAGVIAGNISAEATTPTGNTFDEATRGSMRSATSLVSRSIGGVMHTTLRSRASFLERRAIRHLWKSSASATAASHSGTASSPRGKVGAAQRRNHAALSSRFSK
jgi:hypothetical protein